MTDNPLREARDYMLEHGWCQHEAKDRTGRVCLFGALDMVGMSWELLVTAEDMIKRAILQLIDEGALSTADDLVVGKCKWLIPTVNDTVLTHQGTRRS